MLHPVLVRIKLNSKVLISSVKHAPPNPKQSSVPSTFTNPHVKAFLGAPKYTLILFFTQKGHLRYFLFTSAPHHGKRGKDRVDTTHTETSKQKSLFRLPLCGQLSSAAFDANQSDS